MPSSSPTVASAKPCLHRADSFFSTSPQPLSPASSATSSSPGSPRPQYSPTASEPTLFTRIRTSRSRSRNRSFNRSNSNPAPTSSPTSTPTLHEQHPSRLHFRSDSSPTTSTPNSTQTRSRSQKRSSGTVMQVGRHGNEWLFGGFSFTETVKSLLSPTDGEHGNH